jgi:hypothetical protein
VGSPVLHQLLPQHTSISGLSDTCNSSADMWLRAAKLNYRRMPSTGMLRRVALVGTDISEEQSVSIIRVTRIGELGTLAVTSNRRTLHGVTYENTAFFIVTTVKTSNLNYRSRQLSTRHTDRLPWQCHCGFPWSLKPRDCFFAGTSPVTGSQSFWSPHTTAKLRKRL